MRSDLSASVTIERNAEVVEREFLLTADVCRRLTAGSYCFSSKLR